MRTKEIFVGFLNALLIINIFTTYYEYFKYPLASNRLPLANYFFKIFPARTFLFQHPWNNFLSTKFQDIYSFCVDENQKTLLKIKKQAPKNIYNEEV